MAKQKTRKIVTKRFKLTKTGKIKRKFSMTSHRKRIDTANARNRKKGKASVEGGLNKKIKKMVNN